MRRIVSITLLLLISLPLISPLFAASGADSNLRACCRRDGNHHCMMLSMDQNLATGGADHRLTAMPERCPFYPNPVQTTAVHLLTPPRHQVTGAAAQNNIALPIPQRVALYRDSFDRSRQKRGPPCELPSLL